MITCAEIGTLRDANMITQNDRVKIVNPDVFTQPAMTTNHKVPGSSDMEARLETTTLSDLGTKAAK
tara:strand:+ start:974 stop:1171 length:198 start_codon:yes stop_codon:yes gene_type:complete